jgi:hypothetical protein
MNCIRCGLIKRGKTDFFICEDCRKFSEILEAVYRDINSKIENEKILDPETMPIFRLMADTSFITAKNPKLSIFYKTSSLIITKAFNNDYKITEEELNKEIRTTRGWRDTFKVFEELDLIEVETTKYQRIITLTEKTKKMADQFLQGKPLSSQVKDRHAHIYAGYILSYILTKLARISDYSELDTLPYNQRPRTLWIILMFLFSYAYEGNDQFSEEDLRQFISKRRIPSSTKGRIIRALQAMDGTTVQGLIKNIRMENDERIFEFEDYVLIEMERIREAIRERRR